MEAFQAKPSGVASGSDNAFLRCWDRDVSSVPALSTLCFLELQKFAQSNGYQLTIRRIENERFQVGNHFMVDASLRKDGRSWTSFGDGSSVKEAWEKAVFELCERFFFGLQVEQGFQNGFSLESMGEVRLPFEPDSSNGVACHETPKKAVISAILELIERDAFMCHWLTSKPMTPLDIEHYPDFGGFVEIARQEKLRFLLYQLDAFGSIPVVVAAVWSEKSDPSSFCMGSGAGLTLGEAARKAMMEMIRLLRFSQSSYLQRSSQDQVSLEQPMGRFFFYQRRENFNLIRDFFDLVSVQGERSGSDTSPSMTPGQILDLGSRLGAVVYPINGIPSLREKLFTCAVETPNLQGISFRTSIEVNKARLEPFMRGKEFVLNQQPHPFA